MKIPRTRFVADVPDAWIDRSTLAFVIPGNPALTDPRALQKQDTEPRGSVVVQWHDVPAAMPSLAQFLDDQLPQMRASLTGFELVERGNAGTNEAPLPYLDCRVQGTEPLRQLVMGRVIDGQVVLVTGSAREAWFAALKPAFLDVIRSVRAP